jgi:hypothetical protein
MLKCDDTCKRNESQLVPSTGVEELKFRIPKMTWNAKKQQEKSLVWKIRKNFMRFDQLQKTFDCKLCENI